MSISQDPNDLSGLDECVGVSMLCNGTLFCACDGARAVVVPTDESVDAFLSTARFFVFYRMGDCLCHLPHLPSQATDVASKGKTAKRAFYGSRTSLPGWQFYMGLPTVDGMKHLRYAAVEAFIPLCLYMRRSLDLY